MPAWVRVRVRTLCGVCMCAVWPIVGGMGYVYLGCAVRLGFGLLVLHALWGGQTTVACVSSPQRWFACFSSPQRWLQSPQGRVRSIAGRMSAHAHLAPRRGCAPRGGWDGLGLGPSVISCLCPATTVRQTETTRRAGVQRRNEQVPCCACAHTVAGQRVGPHVG